MGIAALDASLGLLLDIGIEKIQSDLISKVDYLLKKLSLLDGISLLSPTQNGKYAGIVNFRKDSVDNEKLYQYLQNNNVICAYRGEGIRFSPHFYTSTESIDKALILLDEYT
jgi:cysteine desulfurase/selenocysteine lyase